MKMKDEKEVNTEYQDFEKGIQSSMGDQRTAEEKKEDINVDKEVLEARSRNKFFDAERDYYLRGEDKGEDRKSKSFDKEPEQKELEKEQEKQDKKDQEKQSEKLSPSERLDQIDKSLTTETDRNTRQELVNERIELSEQISTQDHDRAQEQSQDKDQDHDFDR